MVEPNAAYQDPESGTFWVAGMDGYPRKASSYEFFFASALIKNDLAFMYQVEFLGGRKISGGMVLDFLVLTRPLYTPVWIQGEYWHRRHRRDIDAFQQALVASGGQYREPLEFWGEDVGDQDKANNTVKREFV